jgi:hypothetical protein
MDPAAGPVVPSPEGVDPVRWWRRFDNSDAGDEAPADDARRRGEERTAERLRVNVRFASWPQLANLFTGNLSEHGLFIRGEGAPPVGAHIQLDLELPSGATLALTGEVMNVITPAEAGPRGIAPGMGIKLDTLEGEARILFDKLLDNARRHLPRPAELSGARAIPPPPSEPPAIAPTDAVHHSVMMRAVGQAIVTVGDSSATPPPIHVPPSSAPRRSRAMTGGGQVIGIDLGLSSTTVTALAGTRVQVLALEDGPRSIPSVVHIDADGRLIAGEAARDALRTAPDRTIAGPKRLLGAKLTDGEVRRYLDARPLTSRAMADGGAAIVVGERTYTGVELCGALLAEARERAVDVLGQPVHQAVVSVPLRWDEAKVDALRRAGERAGLEIVAVIDEPTAVALANRFDGAFGGFIGVFDLGSASCDFTVINAARADLRVLATAGDATLGCDHVDEVVAAAAAEQFQREHQVDLHRAPGAWPRLLEACERAKRALSSEPSATIVVPGIARRAGASLDLSLRLDGELLARAAQPLLERALGHCTRALELADLAPDQLAAVFLSGGGSNLPLVRAALARHLGRLARTGVPPELAIAMGAAMHAARLHFESRPLP